jgi:hypothetical protein
MSWPMSRPGGRQLTAVRPQRTLRGRMIATFRPVGPA